MIRRHGRHGAGAWAVPGGWLEPGEGPLAGALRETREEVGCEVGEGTRVRFVGYTHTLHAEGIEDICLWFGARAPREYEARIAEPARIGAVGWYERRALPTPLFAPVLAALDQGILAQATFL